MSPKKCQICEGKYSEFEINLPFFRHIDFSTISDKITLFKCNQCQLITNFSIPKKEYNSFESLKYAKSNQSDQKKKSINNNLIKTRSYFQAELISKSINLKKNCRILDIGCFDGKLLFELEKRYKKSDLWGQDINTHLKSFFIGNNKINFTSSSLKKLNGKFDLIILSHSILYFPDLNQSLESISNLLNEDGFLYIQMPNIEKNIFYTLMGDQSSIFFNDSLENILNIKGFSVKKIENDIFSREIIFVAKKAFQKKKIKNKTDSLFRNNLNKLNKIKTNLLKIDYDEIAVLGTAVNGAFVDEILKDSLQFFADENKSKHKSFFRSKKIYHPSKLSNKQNVILPFLNNCRLLKKRLDRNYDCNFIFL